jgi:hypothetical protein
MTKDEEKVCMGSFNLISEAIIQIFTKHSLHKGTKIKENMEFLQSKVVSMWCDCSYNFNKDNLIANYYSILSNDERESL